MQGTGRILRNVIAGLAAAVAASVVLVPHPVSAAHPSDAEPPSIQVPLPLSSRQRSDDPDQATGRLVGSIRIPEIGVEHAVRSGVALSVIDQGPAHWVGTAVPGEAGNVVIAGHRSTHGAPFRDLDRLQPGHLVYLTDPAGFEVMYRVSETFIVEPEDVWITYGTEDPVLTIFACHPFGSAAQRIVVRADLVAGRLVA